MRFISVDWSNWIPAYPANPTPGSYMAVEPLNREAAELLSVAHNIDRDNILTGELLHTSMGPGVFGTVDFDEIGGYYAVTYTDQAIPGGMVPIPDASGNPWMWDVTMNDGALLVKVRVEIGALPPGGQTVYLGILIDGVLCGRGPAWVGYVDQNGGGTTSYTLFCSVAVPLGGGTHRVEPVAFFSSIGQDFDMQYGSRAYFWRSAVR